MKKLTTEDVAQLADVKPVTIAGYRHHGRMPPPDGRLGRTVWWNETTIVEWLEGRPGKGWRKAGPGTPEPVQDEPEYNEDGFFIDSQGIAWGTCNACGEECRADEECCEDGEVVPE